MRIVGIQSSPRGRNSTTLGLLQAALDGAKQAGAETELIDVTKLKIAYCNGCLYCRQTGKCRIEDDYQGLIEKLRAANGIILSSPNYMSGITAQLKTVFDRSANCNHEQYFDGKYAFSLMTAGGSDEELVLGIMNDFLKETGANVIGGVGLMRIRGPPGMEDAISRARSMGMDLVRAIEEERPYPEQAAERAAWRERFARTIKANEKNWKHNYEFWIEKGWIKA
jgi:multimeric flavodoxin WrbA